MHEKTTWDLLEILDQADQIGAVWSTAGSDLNVTLLRLEGEQAIPSHVNPEVDVVGVVLRGDGILTVDGRELAIAAGHVFYIARNRERSLHPGSHGIAYLSCHVKRRPLQVRPIRG